MWSLNWCLWQKLRLHLWQIYCFSTPHSYFWCLASVRWKAYFRLHCAQINGGPKNTGVSILHITNNIILNIQTIMIAFYIGFLVWRFVKFCYSLFRFVIESLPLLTDFLADPIWPMNNCIQLYFLYLPFTFARWLNFYYDLIFNRHTHAVSIYKVVLLQFC